MTSLPIIDVRSLVSACDGRREVAAQLAEACSEFGFFYVVGHDVDTSLQTRLEDVSRQFFAQDLETKLEIAMTRGGRAWRGYFPVGGELTSGKPDLKEGIYFGAELPLDHPLVKAGRPLHGPNLFPSKPPQFRNIVLHYLNSMTRLGHSLMAGISLSLDRDESYFSHHYTADPLILFRIFNYPGAADGVYGVGEHTDYGLLTILKQDAAGGLQVKARGRWIAADPVPNSFVCNVGDMLERLTAGRYRSAPHRVQNRSDRDRLSFAFFFDPNFDAEVKPFISTTAMKNNPQERWDGASVHAFQGTYGEYLLSKVSKVFPDLGREVL
jgi:isopenicillin N synthase-like dioxygenase